MTKVFVDVETTSLQHHGADTGTMFLAQFRKGDTTEVLKHPQDREQIQAWLDLDAIYIAWNSKFDLAWLKQAGYDLPDDKQFGDAMVAAHIMDERTSVALQARGDKLFGDDAGADTEKAVKSWLAEESKRRRKESKADGSEYVEPNYSDVPDDIMASYAAHDVELTQKIDDVYWRPIEKEFMDLYELEMGVLRGLFAAEQRGIPMDREALVNLESELLPALDALEDKTCEIANFDNFNPRSPKQISEALDRLGADVRFMTRTDNGQLKTDEENLEACDHPLAEAILAYRGEHKLYAMLRGILHTGSGDSKYPAAYLTPENRLHPNFRQLGARTGRMSCSNPNFQQIHRDDLRLRYAVAAEPGNKLVCCDLDSIELRLLAAFAGDGRMREAVLRGQPHDQTAKLLSLTGRKRTTGAMESARDQGKRMNYLIVYGGGIRAIRKWFGVKQNVAKDMFQRMHDAYPEIGQLQSSIEITLEDRGYVRSPITGRRFRLGSYPRAIDKEGYKFLNYLIQGTAADIIKVAVDRCHTAGIPINAVIHDEIMAEVPEADAEEAAREIEKAMTDGFEVITDKVPITAEAQIVQRWSQAKKADYCPAYMLN